MNVFAESLTETPRMGKIGWGNCFGFCRSGGNLSFRFSFKDSACKGEGGTLVSTFFDPRRESRPITDWLFPPCRVSVRDSAFFYVWYPFNGFARLEREALFFPQAESPSGTLHTGSGNKKRPLTGGLLWSCRDSNPGPNMANVEPSTCLADLACRGWKAVRRT